MSTKIMLAVSREDSPGSLAVYVEEDFDTTIDRIFPVTQPSSSLEARTNQIFMATSGSRVMVHPGNVFLVAEDEDPPDE